MYNSRFYLYISTFSHCECSKEEGSIWIWLFCLWRLIGRSPIDACGFKITQHLNSIYFVFVLFRFECFFSFSLWICFFSFSPSKKKKQQIECAELKCLTETQTNQLKFINNFSLLAFPMIYNKYRYRLERFIALATLDSVLGIQCLNTMNEDCLNWKISIRWSDW